MKAAGGESRQAGKNNQPLQPVAAESKKNKRETNNQPARPVQRQETKQKQSNFAAQQENNGGL